MHKNIFEEGFVMYKYFNPNPEGNLVGDCVIRAICASTGKSWDEVFDELTEVARGLKDMPSSNYVWAAYLKKLGYKRSIIPDTCPDCYTVRNFIQDHPYGNYILGTGTHVIAVIGDNYYDAWDSGNEVPIIYFERR